ncbi:putative glutathione transferase [Helianthus annuus]|nr:putative glutathione transferase [Helianthus annuus]
MADEVTLYADGRSPFVCRVKIALNMKGIKYKNMEEDLQNKSADLLNYNPVHKKVPVLVHNGNPILESLVIVEYLDHVWERVPILPQDPYEKAAARFWAKFIDDKCIPALYKVFSSKGEEEQVIAEACEQLQILEDELKLKGKKFFGGDNINLVDIAADFIAYWLQLLEEATEMKLVTRSKFPKITEWAEGFVNCQVVKEILPPRATMLAYYKNRYGKI